MKPIEFLFDFGSPNAYFSHRVIPGLAAREGARFDYVPILLGGVFKATGNVSPMQAFAGVPAKLAYSSREMERCEASIRGRESILSVNRTSALVQPSAPVDVAVPTRPV